MELTEINIQNFDPVQFFLKLNNERNVSFLHSGGNMQGEHWSILAWNPSKQALNFEEIKKNKLCKCNGVPFCGGYIGYFSYNLGYELFNIKKTAFDDLKIPLVSAYFYRQFLCFDNKNKQIFTSNPRKVKEIWGRKAAKIPNSFGLKFKPEMSKDYYNKAFKTIKEYILDGDIYQVNLTHRLSADFDGDHRLLFAKICESNPAPFSAYFEGDDYKVLSASPERFLKLDGRSVMTCPVKGTRSRGQDQKEDQRFKQELKDSEKEMAELNMITDLLRNDLGQVCEIGSVKVKHHRAIQKLRTVWHTYSTIEGTLRYGLDAINLLKACLPGGSISGCPKKRAMEIIDELELVCRGPYTGAIGYISNCGKIDTSIVIRTLIAKNGKLFLNVGGGIVADSKNNAEYQETMDKAKPFLNL